MMTTTTVFGGGLGAAAGYDRAASVQRPPEPAAVSRTEAAAKPGAEPEGGRGDGGLLRDRASAATRLSEAPGPTGGLEPAFQQAMQRQLEQALQQVRNSPLG